MFVFTFLTNTCHCERSEAMTKDVNTRDNNTFTHSPCHREPSQMVWRSSHNKVARSRVRALFTGLLRYTRNESEYVKTSESAV